MEENAKDTPKQAALREQIENHPIWQYPPQERLSHQREWQDLYLLVLDFKKFKKTLKRRLDNVDESALLADEAQMERTRISNSNDRRTKLDALSFTLALRNAVAKYDAAPDRKFMAYFDAVYVNTLHEQVNKQANRNQGKMALNRREGALWGSFSKLCEKQGLAADEAPISFYKKAAEALHTDPESLLKLARRRAAVHTVSLDQKLSDSEDGPTFDAADPNQEDIQARLERTAEAMRTLAMFANKDMKEYPRLFFTGDVLAPMYSDRLGMSDVQYCALLEKQEDLLWERLFVRGYLEYLFEPAKPDAMRDFLKLQPTHPLQDSSVAAYKGITAAAVSYQRKKYTAMLKELMKQLKNT